MYFCCSGQSCKCLTIFTDKWSYISGIKKETNRKRSKKLAGVYNVQTGENIGACVKNSGFDKSAEVHCPPVEGHGCKSRD